MRPTMKQFYIIMFYKHYSNVYMVNFITQVIAYGMMNLMESPRYDLGCERNHWWSLSWNYRVPTHYMSIIKKITWALPSHALSFIKVWLNPSLHFSTACGPLAALQTSWSISLLALSASRLLCWFSSSWFICCTVWRVTVSSSLLLAVE